ncbi:MAG: hypothetical protein A3H29_00100 [Acidobacteria bacterium RIFCSPLOWO2_02_FULL_67_21]|nr:MAG: hypothetical protein A3H29_00100 [Acidobacteria bacterium RIFCSPLOWO2_02_FULL_67_21]
MAGRETGARLHAPATLDDTGLSRDLILQIVAKTLYFAGELTGVELANRLAVGFQIVEPVLELLRRDQHCEIAGGSVVGAPSYRYRLTDAGRVRASLFIDQSHYVGPLPVPLVQYTAYMGDLARATAADVTQDAIGKAFSHLVLSRRVLDQLGPAIAARHSLFVYGPPGNGKTVIAQAIRNVLEGNMLIPHAIEVEGQIIRLFDPVNHEPVAGLPVEHALERSQEGDARWVMCRRPLVTVGGELTLDALELGQAGQSGFYRAPLQLLANGGVLVIDDFGRQHATPRDLLNRWIVPLESRVDHLTLQTGQKFEVPFQVFVVFATNLKPADLVDEAFLRRIQYKVLATSPTTAEFVEIFANYCRDRNLTFDRRLAESIVADELRSRGIPLRGCHPRDLIEHALALATYCGQPRALTRELLASACATYFVVDEELEAV